ncbi:MAG: hypothetical protein QXE31_06445, partial [Candidatus Woesearchaeota archaeon]
IIFALLSVLVLSQEKQYISSAELTTGELNRSREIRNLNILKDNFLKENRYPNTNIYIMSYPSKNKILIETISFNPVLARDLTSSFVGKYINYSIETRWNRTFRLINEADNTIKKRMDELKRIEEKLEYYEINKFYLNESEKVLYEKLLNESQQKKDNIKAMEKRKLDLSLKTNEEISQIKILREPEIAKNYYFKNIILELFLAALFSLLIVYKIIKFKSKHMEKKKHIKKIY